jgi:hypothetical protein
MSFLPNTFDSVIMDVSLMVEFLVSFSSIDIFTSIRLQQQDIKQKTKKECNTFVSFTQTYYLCANKKDCIDKNWYTKK